MVLSRKDFDSLQYANYPTWVKLSSGSRLVKDGARNIHSIHVGENTNRNVLTFNSHRAAMERGAYSITTHDPVLIVIEGSGLAHTECAEPSQIRERSLVF